MVRIRIGKVVEVISGDADMLELRVEVENSLAKAIAYPALTGNVLPGDTVVLNTTAVHLGLGSGGFHFVQQIQDRCPTDSDQPGHIMKLRYTPWQIRCQSVDEPGAPGHEILKSGGRLDGMPVIAGELHSQLAPAAALAKHETGGRVKIAYIMTDGAALPIAFSRTVRDLKRLGLIDFTITAGHAFGGDYETVNIYSALLAARKVCHADIAIVTMGPGIVGTGTKYGFTGMEQAMILDAAKTFGGQSIAILRLGFGDPRPSHTGISHHSITVLGEMTHCPALVAVPRLPGNVASEIEARLSLAGIDEKHQLVTVNAENTGPVLQSYGLNPVTMGRTMENEPSFFMAAGAAGILAASLVAGKG